MATRYREENLFEDSDEFEPFKTFLPAFPDEKDLLRAIPGLMDPVRSMGCAGFLSWVDFTLENPDEIWDGGASEEKRHYHYLNYIEEEARPPVFVVEVCCSDDLMEVNNYCLIVRDTDFLRLRSGTQVYCRSKEWEKERLVRALNEKALSKYDEECLDEAKELIDLAINLSGAGSAYLFNNRGLISWKMGGIDQAKRDFLESIKLDEANGDPCFNIGLIYLDECDYHRALLYLQRAVDLNPSDSQYLTELGHLYLELDREAEALQMFRKAFETNPADAQVDFHLGHYFLYKKREPHHAVKYYREGLKKDPNDQFALADLAVAHWVVGNRGKTKEIHRALQHKTALMPYTISRLVYLNVEMGDYENALKYYREALTQKEPFELEWLHYHAAVVYAKTGRPQQALHSLDLAVRAGGEAVIKRAMSDKALRRLKGIPGLRKLVKLNGKRRTR
jgi:tetratricopeptide (TPR) repeat protein